MSISYPNQQTATQSTVTRIPDFPLVLSTVFSPSFPITTYGSESQKIADALIPPSSTYNLSGSSYNLVAVMSITGALDATGTLLVEPIGATFQLTNKIGSSVLGEIPYYGDIPGPLNNHAEPGTAFELYMSGSSANLTCSLHKFELIFKSRE